MNKLDVVKFVATGIVSIGVSTVVGNAVKMNTPVDLNVIQKIAVGVGSAVISSMVANAATQSVKSKIDEAADELKKAKDKATEENPE